MTVEDLPESIVTQVRRGLVIPAHPLALDASRRFDERRQRALTRYYLDAGAGGLAVGVHTTQFAIRNPAVGLLDPVLSLASETMDAWASTGCTTAFKVAGVCGGTHQAMREIELARRRGYHAGLVSLTALAEASREELIDHCRVLASVLPIMGFYLQPAVGGRELSYSFWRRFVEIPNVLAIKVAPFNRYATLDVARAVWDSGRQSSVALYTGNDDQILLDLLTSFRFSEAPEVAPVRFVGGLLGQWAVWTQRAVAMLEEARRCSDEPGSMTATLLTRASQLTDANAAIFDAAHGFRGCVAGIHEVLRRQGLLGGTWCLDPSENLSPGQADEIDRVCRSYPSLSDDAFVEANLDRWLA